MQHLNNAIHHLNEAQIALEQARRLLYGVDYPDSDFDFLLDIKAEQGGKNGNSQKED